MSGHRLLCALLAIILAAHFSLPPVTAQVADELKTLKVGDTAKDMTLQPLAGKKVKLSALAKQGPVVLVVLRGFPGYQCPACRQQTADLLKHGKEFKRLGAEVVLIYPGPAQDIKKRAEEFLKGEKLPDPLMLVLDPEYQFTTEYGLRWDAPSETAYPSTFVLDEKRVVQYRKVSLTHGNRAQAKDILAALRALQAAQSAKGQEISQGQ